jgi:hypothetical protein
MAFISQYEADQRENARRDGMHRSIGMGILGGVQGMEENRRRALDERMRQDQLAIAQGQFSMAEDQNKRQGDQHGFNVKALQYQDDQRQLPVEERDDFKKASALERLRANTMGQQMRTRAEVMARHRPEPRNIVQDTEDKKMAEEMVRWNTGAGSKQLENLANLDKAISTLDKRDDITGPFRGAVPDFVRSFTNPLAVQTRQQVEGAVQGSLRETLGAQFTEKEGERIMSNAFNPRLGEGENFRRASIIRAGLKAAVDAKNAQFEYLKANGSMKGYQGPTPVSVFQNIVGDGSFGEEGQGVKAPRSAQDVKSMSDDELLKFIQGQ